MSYPINYPTPQNANVQIFNGNALTDYDVSATWIKPQGASFVWFTLIGSGGTGTGSAGGGSGAVTNFMCPAFLIPDQLSIVVGQNLVDTKIIYRTDQDYILLTAGSGQGNSGGQSGGNNFFTAMGFFQSVSGQSGSASTIAASSTIFLSGGGAQASTQSSNYDYSSGAGGASRTGFFQMQPIIVGTSGMGTGRGGIGCGGGQAGGVGGNGLVVIITW